MGCQGSGIFLFTEPTTPSLPPGRTAEAIPDPWSTSTLQLPLLEHSPPFPGHISHPGSSSHHSLPSPHRCIPSSEINRRYSTQAGSDLSPRWPGHTWHTATSCCCYVSPGVSPAPCQVTVSDPCGSALLHAGLWCPGPQGSEPCSMPGLWHPHPCESDLFHVGVMASQSPRVTALLRPLSQPEITSVPWLDLGIWAGAQHGLGRAAGARGCREGPAEATGCWWLQFGFSLTPTTAGEASSVPQKHLGYPLAR